jgi:hypothetical protein
MTFGDIWKNSRLFKYGLIVTGFLAFGVVGAMMGVTNVPARETLNKLEGQMTDAKQITTTRRRSGTKVVYEMNFRAPSGVETKLTMPESAISETQVRSLFGSQIVVEYDNNKNVFGLNRNGQVIISYDVLAQKAKDDVENNTPGMIGLVLLSALLTFFGYRRAARKLAANPVVTPTAG